MRFANLDLGSEIIIVELSLTTFGASFIFGAAWAVAKIDRNINQTTNLGKFSLPKSMKYTVLFFFVFCSRLVERLEGLRQSRLGINFTTFYE